MTKLLILGTSTATWEIIEYAKSKGIYTIVTDDRDPDVSFAKKWADEYWMINTSETELLCEKCKKENVNGVICGLSEYNIEMMMRLTQRLGLPCYCTPEAWLYSKDKDEFKKLCKKLGVPIAKDYYVSENLTDEELDLVEYPVVVKPVDQNGNRGISYCYNKQELIEAYHYARSFSKSDKIIVEKMLSGKEWYTYYAMADGEISLVAQNGMYAQSGELKNLYSLTSTVSDNIIKFTQEINPKIIKLLKEVGCKEGIAWVQEMLDSDGEFYIIEMGYRLPGDMTFVQYEKMMDFNSIAWLVDYALGKKNDPSELPASQQRAFEKCGCSYNIWVSKEAVLKEIVGLDKVLEIPGVKFHSSTRPGDNMRKHGHVGTFTFVTENCDEMCNVISLINKYIKVLDTQDEDIMIKYTDFDYMKNLYQEGLSE